MSGGAPSPRFACTADVGVQFRVTAVRFHSRDLVEQLHGAVPEHDLDHRGGWTGWGTAPVRTLATVGVTRALSKPSWFRPGSMLRLFRNAACFGVSSAGASFAVSWVTLQTSRSVSSRVARTGAAHVRLTLSSSGRNAIWARLINVDFPDDFGPAMGTLPGQAFASEKSAAPTEHQDRHRLVDIVVDATHAAPHRCARRGRPPTQARRRSTFDRALLNVYA